MTQTYQLIDGASKLLSNQLISDKANSYTAQDAQRFRSAYCRTPNLEASKPINQTVTALTSNSN